MSQEAFHALLESRFPNTPFLEPIQDRLASLQEELKIHLDRLLTVMLAQSYEQLTS